MFLTREVLWFFFHLQSLPEGLTPSDFLQEGLLSKLQKKVKEEERQRESLGTASLPLQETVGSFCVQCLLGYLNVWLEETWNSVNGTFR